MAMRAEELLLGVDVAKAEIVIHALGESQPQRLANERRAISRYLKSLPGPACLAVEATGTYHLDLVERAHALGHHVYLIDGYRLNRYRESIGGRAKTDASDAQLLLRYLQRERAELRAWTPPPAGYDSLQRLLRRRAALVRAEVALRQSLRELPALKRPGQALLRQMQRLEQQFQAQIYQLLRQQGWAADAARCDAIEGVGPLTAAALAVTFRRGAFSDDDAFIAYLGLDVRVRDSGRYHGRRKLTKKGNPELRRLLYLAAMAASRSATWQPCYQRYRNRGLSRIHSLVILARKLARVAFALMKKQTTYQPKPHIQPGAGT